MGTGARDGDAVMLFKCTGCKNQASLDGRHAAIASGWTFVEFMSKARIKYVVLCASCAGTCDWLKKALKD